MTLKKKKKNVFNKWYIVAFHYPYYYCMVLHWIAPAMYCFKLLLNTSLTWQSLKFHDFAESLLHLDKWVLNPKQASVVISVNYPNNDWQPVDMRPSAESIILTICLEQRSHRPSSFVWWVTSCKTKCRVITSASKLNGEISWFLSDASTGFRPLLTLHYKYL